MRKQEKPAGTRWQKHKLNVNAVGEKFTGGKTQIRRLSKKICWPFVLIPPPAHLHM